MSTARALRRLKPDPIPEELITKVLEAATKASSGGAAAVVDIGLVEQSLHTVVVLVEATS